MTLLKTSNGVYVNIIPSDKFTGNLISLYFIFPLDNMTSTNALLAKVLEHSNGKLRTPEVLNEELELNYGADLYVSCGMKGERQVIKFTLSFIKDSYALNGEKIADNMADLLYNIIRNPLFEGNCFNKDVVSVEKQNLKDLILSRINNKRSYAITRCREKMCENEDYGKDGVGTIEEIEKITDAQLYEHYNSFLNKSDVVLQFIGDFSESFAFSLANRIFPEKRASEYSLGINMIKNSLKTKEFEEQLNVNQSVLVLGYRIGIEYPYQDRYAYLLMNSILGGGTSSLLFKNVREKLSLCYFCASSLDSLKGIMFVYSGIAAENKEKTINAVKEQIKTLITGGVTEEELKAAKADIETQYKKIYDSQASMNSYLFSGFFSESPTSIDEIIENVKKIELPDVVAVAKKLSLDTIYFLTGLSKGDESHEQG